MKTKAKKLIDEVVAGKDSVEAVKESEQKTNEEYNNLLEYLSVFGNKLSAFMAHHGPEFLSKLEKQTLNMALQSVARKVEACRDMIPQG